MDRQMGALRGFQANQRALQEAETGYRSARERVAQLTAAIRQTRQPTQQTRKELGAAHREANRARQVFEVKQATLAESRHQFDNNARSTRFPHTQG
jgi:chromosome segregation ATPase